MTWLEELDNCPPLKPIENGSEYDPYAEVQNETI